MAMNNADQAGPDEDDAPAASWYMITTGIHQEGTERHQSCLSVQSACTLRASTGGHQRPRVQQPGTATRCTQIDAGGRVGTGDLLKQLVRMRLPVATDQKAFGLANHLAVDRNSGDIWGHGPNRISSVGPAGCPDRFKLAQLGLQVLPGRSGTVSNCNLPAASSHSGSGTKLRGNATVAELVLGSAAARTGDCEEPSNRQWSGSTVLGPETHAHHRQVRVLAEYGHWLGIRPPIGSHGRGSRS